MFERIEDQQANPEYFGPATGIKLRRVSKAASPTLYDVLEIIKPLPNDTIVSRMSFAWKLRRGLLEKGMVISNRHADADPASASSHTCRFLIS